MPIYCRYLFGQYFKVLLFCTLSFIAVLLTTRMEDIAHFATLGAEGVYVLCFTLYQIPYILPIAIPISSLISVIILMNRLSVAHEITAFRASGLSIRGIIAPILFGAACLSLVNFYIVSELATQSHLQSGLLKSELRSINPLLLLHNKHFMRLKGIYFDTLGASRLGELANDVIVAMPNKNNNRINLMIAENLEATPSEFIGKDVTLITTLENGEKDKFDHLIIENIGRSKILIEDFVQLLQNKVWTLNNDHLRLSLLLTKINEEKQKYEDKSSSELKMIRRNINSGYSEILRRISISLAVFSFTLLSIAFSINISRRTTNKGLFFIIGLVSIYMMTFLTAKAFADQFFISILLYLVPHIIIMIISSWMLYRTSEGRE